MSIFGNGGFLGLGKTKFGQSISGVLGDVRDFVIEAPNKGIDFFEDLGETIFDTSSGTADKFKEEAIRFKSRQASAGAGNAISKIILFVENNLLIIGLAVIAWLTFNRK